MSGVEEHTNAWHEAQGDENATAIAEALASLRPDAEDFAGAVKRRIEGAERNMGNDAQSNSAWVRFVRRAAVFVPIWLLPKPLLKLLAVATVPAAKKSAWYYLPGIVALPAIMVALSVVSFFFAVKRAVVRDETEPRVDIQVGFDLLVRKYILHFFAAVIPLAAFVVYRPLDGAVLVLLALLALAVALVQISSRALTRTRSELGLGFSLGLGFLCMFSPLALMAESHWTGDFGARWVFLAFVLGSVACVTLARPSHQQRRVGVLLVWFGAMSLFNLRGAIEVPNTRDDAIRFVERGPSSRGELRRFRDIYVAALDEFTVNRPEHPPNIAVLTAQLVADRRQSGDTTSESVLERELNEFGYYRGRDYDAIDGSMLARILAPQTTWGQRSLRDAVKGLKDRELSLADREELAKELLLGSLDPGEYLTVGLLLEKIELLSRLGFYEATVAMAKTGRELVRLSWTQNAKGPGAGFDFDQLARYDRNGQLVAVDFSPYLYLPDSAKALELMTHFGVPEGVDLEALESFLRSRSLHPIFEESKDVSVQAYFALEALQRLPEWRAIAAERATLFARLLRYRVLIAALLLVLFCIVVTLRAPKEIAETEPAV